MIRQRDHRLLAVVRARQKRADALPPRDPYRVIRVSLKRDLGATLA